MLGDIFTDYEMVEMVTSGAAYATNWEDEVGTIVKGTAADLVVIDNIHSNPYRNLINAVDPDVRLSIVGGLAIYGDEDIMTALKGTDHEPAGKFGKAVDITYLAAPEGAQTWASITENLTMAMRFDPDEMAAAFGDASDFDSVTSGMSNVGLDPWYTYGDERYFSVINGSGNANAQISMSMLYDRYYDRAESLPAVTDFEVIEGPTVVPCDDGSNPPCDNGDSDNGGTDNNGGTDTTDNTDTSDTGDSTDNDGDTLPDNPLDDQQSSEEETKEKALLLFFVLVVVMLVALFFVSRGGEDALAAEVRIEKMWEEGNEEVLQEAAFVPSMPPMAPPPAEEE